MVNYEGQREKQEVASVASVAPDAFRTGDFSAITTPLRDPLGGTFAGNPRWGTIRYLASDVKSYYQSMQVRGERRFSRGFSFLSSYTWAHNIDQAYGTNESLPFTPGGAQNQNCFACERANSGFDYRYRFVTSFLWNIPARTEWRGPLAFIVKNWSFNGIVTFQSGFPFTVTQSGNSQNTGAGTQRPDHVAGQNPELANPDPARWFNTNAFVRLTNKYGNVGRNTLRQPGMKLGYRPVQGIPGDLGAAGSVPMGSVQPLEHAAIPCAQRAARHANLRPDHLDMAR